MPRRPRFAATPGGSPTYARGMKWPAWALLALPFAFLMAWLLPLVRRRVRWTACWLTVLVFEAVLIPVEHNSLIRGHWVYNEHRILGPKLWGIPIEEPLIYYLLPPILVIMVFEFTVARLEAARLPDWRAALARLVRRVPETAVGLLRRTG